MFRSYVLVAHGSREPRSNRAFLQMVGRLKAATKAASMAGAFLELAEPRIPETLEKAAASGAREIVVVPLMLFPGRHAVKDIPALVRAAAARHKKVRFRLKKSLALHSRFLGFLKEIL
ncbi:MAG TPA: CbiX/SirB N-terminal domain-containing protein [bacterium]|nr:CbiX/SirB N-terminal domain-containing protein [bacterium]